MARAMAVALASGKGFGDALALGTRDAARAVQKRGAQASYPTLADVEAARARIDGADGSITQLSLDAGTLQTRLTSAEGNVAALEQTVSDQGARIALVTDADGVTADPCIAALGGCAQPPSG